GLPEPSGPIKPGRVLISEVKYLSDPASPEFVELYVLDSGGLDLGGWYLTTFDGDEVRLPAITGLRDFSYVLVVFGAGEDDLDASDGVATVYLEDVEDVLDDGGDEVALYDSNDNLRDYVRYSGGNGDPVLGGWRRDDPGPEARRGESIQLLGEDVNDSSNWVSSSPSGGLPNVVEFKLDEQLSVVLHNGRHNTTYVERLRGVEFKFTPRPGVTNSQLRKIGDFFKNAWRFLKKEGYNLPQAAADGKVHVIVSKAASTKDAGGGTSRNGVIQLDISGVDEIDQQIITHEFMHLVQARTQRDKSGRSYMRWNPNGFGIFLDEGYAEYYGYKKLAEEKGLGWRAVLDKFEREGLGGLGAFQSDINIFTGWPERGWGRYTSAFLFTKMIADNFGQRVLVGLYQGIKNYGEWNRRDPGDSIGIDRVNHFLEYEFLLMKNDIPYTDFIQLYYKWVQENYLDGEFGGDEMYKGISFQAQAYEVVYRGGRMVIDRDLRSQEMDGEALPPANKPGPPTDRADLVEWGVDYLRIKVETDKCFKIRFDGDDRGRFYVKAIQIKEKGGKRFYDEEVMALDQKTQSGVIIKQDPKKMGLQEVVLVMARLGRPWGDRLGGRLPYVVVIEQVEKSPPKPAPGYRLSGYVYVKNFTVVEWWTEQPKNETSITLSGYKISSSELTIEKGQVKSSEIETYLYEKKKPETLEKFEFKCPIAPEGFELKGKTLVKNFQLVEAWGEEAPSAGGFIYLESKIVVVNYTLREDWILTCVYEPVELPKPQKKAEEFLCPLPKEGFELTGYSHMKDFVLVESWGEQNPSPEGYVYVRSNSTVKDYVLVSDEVWTCTYEPIGWKKPDLSVNIFYEGETPKVGELVPITVTVKNLGDDATRDATLLELYVDGKRVAEEEIPAGLKVGEELRFNYKLTFDEAGEHKIKAVVDSINWIIEKDEDNNVDELVLAVTGLPDLTVEWVQVPSQTFGWMPVKISFKVKNTGTDSAYNFTVSFECTGYAVCNPPFKSWKVLALAPGEEKTFSLDVVFPPEGLYTVRAIADIDEVVKESNEENNVIEFLVQVLPPPLPDLAIEQASYEITVTYVGETATSHIKVNMTIINFGVDVNESFLCRIMLGGLLLGEETVPGLRKGEIYTITMEVTVNGDVRGMMLRYIVDAANAIEEEDEENNVATLVIKRG
ncbi:MAG: lamin tail domain-containing protein, partial [Thaumarchaeota archaeon]|nr:lamin tail domain-containing protein [Nitrososphaerota archaeon]